jgi:adenosylcobinamide kinase/adenosylcobinamide-phosphate guanylyltransferase
MRVILSGTGPSEGFPVPGCWCPACATATRAGVSRAPAALVAGPWTLDAKATLSRHPGTRLTDDLRAEALPGAVLLTTPTSAVLWAPAPSSAPLLVEALRGRPLTTAYLGPPAPPAPDTTEADPSTARNRLGHLIARLRAAGAVADATEIAVVGLHETDPVTLPLILGAWGAHAPAEGSEPGPALPRLAPGLVPRLGGRTVLLGGSGSGKSALAEDLLAAEPDVLYVATGAAPTASDLEWTRRVERHRARRPQWWATEECGAGALGSLLVQEDRPVLLDSVGSWLTSALDRVGAWDERPGWRTELAALTTGLVGAWRARRAPLVAVTEEVGWSVVAPSASGRLFTSELGRLNQRLAAESESLLVVAAGRVIGSAAPG